MPRTREPYPSEFRQQMIELVKADRTPEELSREFEPTAQAGGPATTDSGSGSPAEGPDPS
jgi:transposase